MMDPELAGVQLHGPEEFEGMRKAGKLAAEVLDFITPHVVPGVSTLELDTLCHNYILEHEAIPAPLNYRGFPKSICTSVNHVVCHGIPEERKRLGNGDIINIDITVILDGWHGDTSRMFLVGDKVGVRAKNLVQTTYECMMRGIEIVRPGVTLGDIGHAIQSYAEERRFSVVRDFCGHGLGRIFHSPPSVMHFGEPGTGPRLVEGMFFTIEPSAPPAFCREMALIRPLPCHGAGSIRQATERNTEPYRASPTAARPLSRDDGRGHAGL